MMTKKHFIEIAKILADHKDNMDVKDHFELVYAFAAFCKRENGNFDMGRFVAAAKGEK